jgi:hypothetical protein
MLRELDTTTSEPDESRLSRQEKELLSMDWGCLDELRVVAILAIQAAYPFFDVCSGELRAHSLASCSTIASCVNSKRNRCSVDLDFWSLE